MQKIRRFKLALLLVARSVTLSPPARCTHIGVSVPFFFFLSRYHISIQPTSTTTSYHPPLPPPSSPSTTTTSSSVATMVALRFHPYFHSIPSSPRFESSMRSPVRKKGALKRFLLAMETPSPTPYRVYRVPHITNVAFLLSCDDPSCPPCPRSFVFLVLFLSRRLTHSFVLLPTQCASSFASHARPDT